MEFLGFVGVPAIIIICFFIAELFKLKVKDEGRKSIPTLVMLVGAILGGIAFITLPNYLIAENLLEGVAIGIISGLASTGAYEFIDKAREMI